MKKLTGRRGRRYSLEPLPGFRDKAVAQGAAILDEARERCVDLIANMSEEAMWTKPAGSPFSGGDLVVHMNWAEYVWLTRIGQHQLPDEMIPLIERGKLDRLYDPDPKTIAVSDLVALCRRTREQVVMPCLAEAGSLEQEIAPSRPGARGPKSVREILMHVTASWIYHSGQVGLMTMQNGLDYVWTFE